MATDERKDLNRIAADRSRAQAPARRDDWSSFWHDPFGSFWRGDPFRRWTNEMDRWFHDPARTGSGSAFGRHLTSWTPDVEAFQRRDQFVVRADLPGMKKEDVTLQIADDALTIEGERRFEHEDEREGYYRSERSYGRFCRVIPLPEGAIVDSAKATFREGVLEVVMQAPPKEVAGGRRLEISDSPASPPQTRANVSDNARRQAGRSDTIGAAPVDTPFPE
jgi:HSP20 family protein